VHSSLDHHGFGPSLIAIARATGVSGYVADGENRWPAVHTLDAARVYRLARGRHSRVAAARGRRRGRGVSEIAAVIGGKLGLPSSSIAPEDANEHFTFLGGFVSLDSPASSELTREWLGWQSSHPGLIEDLQAGHYFED
jgi:hypothetical protein